MKFQRIKCDICSSKRLESKIKIVKKHKICNKCISSNKVLKSYFNEYYKIKKISTDEEVHEESLSNIIDSLLLKENNKNEIKNEIKKEIMDKVSSHSNKKILAKTLNSFSFSELQDCEESLKSVDHDLARLKEKISVKRRISNIDLPNPIDIMKNLNKNIIDQSNAVESVTLALIQHLCRIKDTTIPKNNILILGPTGTGKTELARVMSNYLDIPLVIIDATSLTAEGYVGASLSDTIINSLMQKLNGNKDIAENSIVFIDEIDKKALNRSNESTVNTLAIQNELLKILEGTEIRGQIFDQDSKQNKKIVMNTNNILFICAGAFSGMDDILKNKKGKNKIGLNNDKESSENLDFSNIETSDLKNYGMTPEFLGRFSTITYTKNLSRNSLIKILTSKNNSILEQYKRIFSQYSVNVNFSEEFIESIVNEAEEQEIGARGLNKIFIKKIQPVLLNIYKFVNKNIKITNTGVEILENNRQILSEKAV